MAGDLCTALAWPYYYFYYKQIDVADVTLGASGHWLGTRTGAGGHSPWLHEQQETNNKRDISTHKDIGRSRGACIWVLVMKMAWQLNQKGFLDHGSMFMFQFHHVHSPLKWWKSHFLVCCPFWICLLFWRPPHSLLAIKVRVFHLYFSYIHKFSYFIWLKMWISATYSHEQNFNKTTKLNDLIKINYVNIKYYPCKSPLITIDIFLQ